MRTPHRCRHWTYLVAIVSTLPLAHVAWSASHDPKPLAPSPKETTSIAEDPSDGRNWHWQTKMLLQSDWRHDEPTESSLGPGSTLEAPLFRTHRVAVGLEVGADVLFKEGDIIVPFEVGLNAAIETETIIEPFFGIAPVVSVDFGGETEVHYGAAMSLGVTLHTGRMLGFFVQGTYRLLGGQGFRQQLALSLGPVVFF